MLEDSVTPAKLDVDTLYDQLIWMAREGTSTPYNDLEDWAVGILHNALQVWVDAGVVDDDLDWILGQDALKLELRKTIDHRRNEASNRNANREPAEGP